MASPLEIDGRRGTSSNLKLLFLHHHLPPAGLRLILQGVRRVEFLDVEVLLIQAEDRESPPNLLVVSQRYARQSWLTRADYIPSRCHQVHHVTQRGLRDHAMR